LQKWQIWRNQDTLMCLLQGIICSKYFYRGTFTLWNSALWDCSPLHYITAYMEGKQCHRNPNCTLCIRTYIKHVQWNHNIAKGHRKLKTYKVGTWDHLPKDIHYGVCPTCTEILYNFKHVGNNSISKKRNIMKRNSYPIQNCTKKLMKN
jgi:hypothetical protein